MPNVMGREFPYTPQGMAEAEQYRQAVGMRGGGMMGFRPVGYQTGGVIDRDDSFAEGEAFDQATREAIIENIMELTGMQNPSALLEMSDEQLMAAQQTLMAASAAANPPPPAYPPGVREMLGAGTEIPENTRAMQRLGQEFGDSRISNYDARAMQDILAEAQRPGSYDYETQLLRERSAPYMMAEDERAAGTNAQEIQQNRELRELLDQMNNEYPAGLPEDMPNLGRATGLPVGRNRGGIMSLRGY